MSKAGTYSNQGDDYQRAIAIHWIIKLLTDSTIEYVQVESNGLIEINDKVTVDDIVVVYTNGNRLHIQAKKNQPQQRQWSIKDWGSELPKILFQLEQGENITVELYSSTPLGEFATLLNECSIYPNFDEFKSNLSKTNTDALSILVNIWNRSENEIFNLLKRLKIGSHLNIEQWEYNNKESLFRIVTRAPLALVTLEAFINKHQSKDRTNKLEIRASDVMEELTSKGLTRLPSLNESEIIEQFKRKSSIGRTDWKRTIAGEKIARNELNDIMNHIQNKKNTILVQDRPGSGKTCLLLDLADAIEKDNKYHLLFIKGDRFAKVHSDTSSFQKEIVQSCGLLSSNAQVIVVIDSLDVLSCQRDHNALTYFLRLIDQLQVIQNVTVVAACREFDLKYDPMLRERKWDVEIKLKDFDFQTTVLPIISKLNVDIDQINPELKELLCLPQNLSLFEKVTAYKGVFDIRTTYDLYNAFIDYTLKHDPDVEDQTFEKIYLIAEQLLKKREQSLTKTLIKIDEHTLHNLVSKGVLNEETDGKVSFSHQTLFDNFVASNALKTGITLSNLILEHPPLPFYRPSVRSYLFFIRSQSFKSFSKDIRETLSNNDIAYHFKRLIVETYAEMLPINDDWNLMRWMFLNQNDLFKRFFWAIKSKHWFELVAYQWYPFLDHQPENIEWRSIFIRKLNFWMNFYPSDIVEIWNNALLEEWGKENIWAICRDLTGFKHYHVDNVKTLLLKLKGCNNQDSHFMGTIYCNYIEATGDGYEILWDWMTRDISIKELKTLNKKNELYCETHDLRDGIFLKKHLVNSELFLNLVMNSLFNWVKEPPIWKEYGLTNNILEYTSISDNTNRFSSLNIENIKILIQALEEAILNHAKNNSEWWNREEKKLRNSNESGIRYILIKAYLENIEDNLDGISTQLLDKELFESGELNFELGLLINKSFPLLDEEIQDKIVTVIENLFTESTGLEENYKNWCNRVKFELFIRIPAYQRANSVNNFIDNFIPQFGYYQPSRILYSSGGFVSSPVYAEILDNLSKDTLYALFNYYQDYKEHSFHPADNYRGGLWELSRTILSLAKNNPAKYLNLLNYPKFEAFSESITKPIGCSLN